MCTRCKALGLDYEEPILCCCGDWGVLRDSTYYLADQDCLSKVNEATLPECKERYLQRKEVDANGTEMLEVTAIAVQRLHARTSRMSEGEKNNEIEKRMKFAGKKAASRHWPTILEHKAQEAKAMLLTEIQVNAPWRHCRSCK